MSIIKQNELIERNYQLISSFRTLDEALAEMSDRNIKRVETDDGELFEIQGVRFGSNKLGYFFYRTIAPQ